MQSTKIEYLDQVWNPIAMRCDRVSAGCKNCWHLRMTKRMAGIYREKNPPVEECPVRMRMYAYNGGKPWLNKKKLSAPLKRKKPSRIGVQFMGDLFHPSIPYEWIAAVYGAMAAAPQHQFFVLTKRPAQRTEFLSGVVFQDRDIPEVKKGAVAGSLECTFRLIQIADPGYNGNIHRKYNPSAPWPLQNVLEGVSVEDQRSADARIPALLDTTAAKRWISYEPALGPVNFGLIGTVPKDICSRYSLVHEHIDGIVAGAETGPGSRPADNDWFRSARDQCAEVEVPFFFKQGSAGSRLLDGRMHAELP